MDHPCYKCGHSIEDGKAFCPQCGAPQIRVAIAEPSALPNAGNIPSSDRSIFPLDAPAGTPLSIAALSAGIVWPRALRVCGVAALISVVTMSLRLLLPLLAVLGAGFLAVILYRYRNPTWKANARTGAQLGVITALISSGVLGILSAIAFAILQTGGQVRQQALEALQQVATRSNDPQMQATLDILKNQDGLAPKLILAIIGFIVISIPAGGIAGALSVPFFRRRKRPLRHGCLTF